MPVIRGSTHGLYGIAETTFGTTPATPNLKQIPFVSFGMRHNHTSLRSEQMRSHPFVDKIVKGRQVHELTLEVELQPANHDFLLEAVFGANITAKALKLTDALKGVTLESRTAPTDGLYNAFAGAYFNRMDINVSASDTAPIRMTLAGQARTGALDGAATIATGTTAAADVDPYTFIDAAFTEQNSGGGAPQAKDIVSGTISIERAVDPLNIWGTPNPREYVPAAATVTGTVTVPWDDDYYSQRWTAFSDREIVYNLGGPGGVTFRKLMVHRAKYVSLGRAINTRGGLMQEVNWEATYSPTQGTPLTLTTE